MARLCGPKILLLWTGIIGLAYCQDPAAITTPAITSKETTPTTTSTTNQTVTQALGNLTPTSPPTTQSNTTVTPTTKGPTPPPPPQCSYTVTPIKFGFQINFINSPPGNYTVNVKEEVKNETGMKYTVQISDPKVPHHITHLKPCTNYKHNVTFDHAGKEIVCKHSDNKTTVTTMEMTESDIKLDNCTPGYLCYKSDWNISSVQITANNIEAVQCPSDNKTFCIKPGYDDICTNLTTTFTQAKCVNFSLTQHISADKFLNSSEINVTPPTELPAKIEANLPPNCIDLTIDYICSDSYNNPKNVSELEPFTDYTCTGQIKENDAIIKNTSAIHVRINCDLNITTQNSSTDTSIDLNWTTTSQNCPKVPELDGLSYDCSCQLANSKQKQGQKPEKFNKQRPGGTCHFSGLKPFTDYICEVQPTYNNKQVAEPAEVTEKTKAGVPGDFFKFDIRVPEHNKIEVICRVKFFHGPKELYNATLRYNGVIQKTRLPKTDCNFSFEDLSYLTTYDVEVVAFNGYHSNTKTERVDTRYNDKALIGFLVFLIILTSVALLVVVYKIFILKRRKSHDMGENMMLISTTNDEENLLPVEPIAADALLEAYKRKLADEGRLFLAEFQSIPRIFSRYTVKEAKKACNTPKNRYVDILPYDYNRVQLTTGNGETGCDYINASFIDGYKESKKYIAAQGPKEETVGDFWRMIWEQQSSIIVMVTRCEEGNRVKCAQYWPSPDRETEIFDEFIVKLNSEDQCPDYTIRHLSLTNKRDKNSEREVTHIQFMSWPDHGVPGEPHLLLKLRRRVNAFKNFFSGPIVVHCSAGVGRTGTYICIDAMMEGLEAENRVDIYGYVVRLRRQRCLMVQVEAQYILIHQALLEYNQFGETEIPLSELHSALSTLKQKSNGNEPTLLEDEFERLPNYKTWRTFNTGITEENKKKNRSSSVVPYDYNRVLLKLDEGHSRDSDHDEDEEEESSDEEDEESTKYINASHIDGYWGPRTLITAQTPLPDTIPDFWTMVHQKKASTIVMLSDGSEGDEDSVYWDKEKKTFGEIEVEVTSTEASPTVIRRNMQIRHVKRKESRSVKQFQFLKWVNTELPEKPQDLTDMIKDIKHSCGSSKSQGRVPILVHCNDGSSRSGIFCALWNLLDSAETEKLVDVFQVVKTIRKERQGCIPSLDQYQFLYDALEGVYPVQNGEVKAAQAPAADSVQIVNETKAAEQPEQLASTTSNDQQGAAESAPLVADGGKEEDKVSSSPTETTPLEDTSNGTTVTSDV
ncbi:receptor-type tyrosine-protein phosphatase C isoform X2 [Thunnus maccoyii]|uniref:receptor-type tyrosine-protein phosphatase C isoform X2 n=1 Tax=Thunnus maccoyii TaxID=8240 RepID=UPI001C4BFFEE|nr:receptor-type tyrosine-protein phosphatase C isoform X2 [Thunnus maccoyii]